MPTGDAGRLDHPDAARRLFCGPRNPLLSRPPLEGGSEFLPARGMTPTAPRSSPPAVPQRRGWGAPACTRGGCPTAGSVAARRTTRASGCSTRPRTAPAPPAYDAQQRWSRGSRIRPWCSWIQRGCRWQRAATAACGWARWAPRWARWTYPWVFYFFLFD